jgi:hypothetical protein
MEERRIVMKTLVVAGLLFFLSGCGGGEGVGRGGRDVLTAEELATVNETNLYDAIKKLRPMFLVSRGATSLRIGESTLPRVYLDGSPYGDPESLRNMPLTGIYEVRFIDSRDATILYGTGHTAGIIMVKTKGNL